LQTSDPSIFAIGEVALHDSMIYGLVAPGYEMAEIVAGNLCDRQMSFTSSDLSTKLKLMGVDVASFGDYEAGPERAQPLLYEDPFGGVYRKLLFDLSGTRLLGGVLVGDAADYGLLSALAKSPDPLPCAPGILIAGSGGGGALGADSISDDGQVCSCNNVTKGQICAAIRDNDLVTLGDVKACTQAGAGCGGCVPLLTDILNAELMAAGKTVDTDLCEHFAYTRQELFEIVQVKQIRNFEALIHSHGRGDGCEICKPTVTSILASLWNEQITEPAHWTLQDTNDRFLANVQRGGLYSVVPRVPGGEITPDKLITLGRVAKRFGLYTKITGGQRVDLFGAQVQQLPAIWEELVNAGFESGHAYGKSLRTVKSCVGTTWCRYGVQDSVGFAIRLEQRYRGIRSPHKMKMAVSGCIRECAEAQCKDIGLVATENGYNLYVGGNGGAKPRHAEMLATDIDEATAVKYIDRFMIYYVRTADKLARTAVWLGNLEGGIQQLKNVVIEDSLGLCEEFETQMQYLVDTYKCEWKEVVNNPEKRKLFCQFVNPDETEQGIEVVAERNQRRPADRPKDFVPISDLGSHVGAPDGGLPGGALDPPLPTDDSNPPRPPLKKWVNVGRTADFPENGGAAIKYGKVQIAVFNFTSRGQWYACQNMCPHKNALVLSRGIVGSAGEAPKISCPLHKKPFSLQTGECLSGDDFSIKIFPVRIDGNAVLVELPPQVQLVALLATQRHCVGACDTIANAVADQAGEVTEMQTT
jgi:nitrite reductase (NADH) large subunit